MINYDDAQAARRAIRSALHFGDMSISDYDLALIGMKAADYSHLQPGDRVYTSDFVEIARSVRELYNDSTSRFISGK